MGTRRKVPPSPADLMSTWNHYYLAKTIEDALQALASAQGSARIIAGGTDLLLDLQQGRHPPVDTLVDVNHIPEMRVIEWRGEEIYIGAATPLRILVESALVQEHAQALVEACGQVGGPQVRNSATLGGNVAHALPAADGSIALTALDAQVEVASAAGSRRLPIGEVYQGPGQSALDSAREVLVGFYLRRVPGNPNQAKEAAGSAFQRVMRPQGVALPVLNAAAYILQRGGVMADVRIAIGPAGLTPFRARESEAVLRGHALSEIKLDAAQQALLQEAHFRSSPQRASAEYRQQLAGVLLRAVITKAWERARYEI
ncbi:MAG: xanthine dehydrogenase family protein subunit M [Anaerolineales bacterium]|nr:xanthine dehydrogenase family protein subunit M [Anaerolineales bacterium]